jgi:acyl-coenzyme A thioesterase PaaI-like protein
MTEGDRGAWAERRRLARALRELTRHAVISGANAETLHQAADRAEAALALLETSPVHRLADSLEPGEFGRSGEWVDRSALAGLSNPLAPPLRAQPIVNGRVIAEADYTEAFEGAPGLVHGGHLAAAFDHVTAVVAAEHARPILTAKLKVRYKKPTPLRRTVRFEAELERQVHTLLYVAARSIVGGVVTAEAEVVFMHVAPSSMGDLLAAASGGLAPLAGSDHRSFDGRARIGLGSSGEAASPHLGGGAR